MLTRLFTLMLMNKQFISPCFFILLLYFKKVSSLSEKAAKFYSFVQIQNYYLGEEWHTCSYLTIIYSILICSNTLQARQLPQAYILFSEQEVASGSQAIIHSSFSLPYLYQFRQDSHFSTQGDTAIAPVCEIVESKLIVFRYIKSTHFSTDHKYRLLLCRSLASAKRLLWSIGDILIPQSILHRGSRHAKSR